MDTPESLDNPIIEAWAVTRSGSHKEIPVWKGMDQLEAATEEDDRIILEDTVKWVPESEMHHSEQVLYTMTQDRLEEFQSNYQADLFFCELLGSKDLRTDLSSVATRFVRSLDGLLWFCEAD
ncbi:hypothetical protein FRB95_013012 [Tulasnella sp. JGI-2019a]|nr:hypothetical protein FRB95_013012 [Tulasnella sp. JGI-2019a]